MCWCSRGPEKALLRLGWLVGAVGVVGMAVFAGFWVAGDLMAEQGVSLVLGTTLGTTLSGATAYGAGVNMGSAPSACGSRPLRRAAARCRRGSRPLTG